MAALQTWALPQLSRLLPLDEESLKQIITYTDTLPKDAAAEHLKNLLGDSPQAFEFISSFNTRRQTPPSDPPPPTNHDRSATPTSGSEVPRARARPAKRGRGNIHALPARQVEGQGSVGAAYRKRDVDDYIPSPARKQQVADNLALQEKAPDATQMPLITDSAGPRPQSKPPPSAAGNLISDALSPSKKSSAQSSRNASPAPKTKVTIAGGKAMHGASTALSDLDSAIKALEIQTNPTLSSNSAEENKKRKCNCMATRHPLLDMAPNCLNCGKIICVKEGLGPCTFCNSPLLSSREIADVVRVLKDERGQAKMEANNAAHKRAEVAQKPKAFSGRDFLASTSSRPSPVSSVPSSDDEAQSKAKEHRDKLLNFQANNARRTQIHDEAADFDLPTSGTSMWASPQERAQQLKKQQKMLREMEWNARPEYEKRRMVASIDVKGGKVMRKMAAVEKPASFSDGEDDAEEDYQPPAPEGRNGGAFSRNPLMGGLIRPMAAVSKGKEKDAGEETKKNTWRRVQDENDDNEQWILDGGVYGGRIEGRVLGAEEHAFA